MRSLSARTIGLAVGLSTLAACGSGGSANPDAQQVANTVKQFEQAALNHDGATYCSLLTPAERAVVLQSLSHDVGLQGPCATELHATLNLLVTGGTRANANVTTANVTVNGNLATVTLPGDGRRIQLTKVGGSWKVSSLPPQYFAG